MPIDEKDLELLETYLDGELPMSEAEGLWQRLNTEPALRAELDQLRADRTSRGAVWEALEPSDQAATALCATVGRSIRRRNVFEWVNRGARYAMAAAACVVIGIQIGNWNTRAAGGSSVATGPTAPAAYQVAIRDSTGNIIASPHFDTKQEAVEFVDDLTRSQGHVETHEPPANIIQTADEQF